jgi:integrase
MPVSSAIRSPFESMGRSVQSDVNFALSRVFVSSSLYFDQTSKVMSGAYILKSPKNGRIRPVPLSPRCVAALQAHRARQNERRLRAGGAEYRTDLDIVVSTAKDEPLHPDRFTANFRRLSRSAGVPVSRPHCLRHTCASPALAGGVNPLAISQILGHHDASFTLRQYGHSLPDSLEQAAFALDAAVVADDAEVGDVKTDAVQKVRG